jgi:hypothetical protein
MMSQLHKRFTSDQVQELLERYLKKEVERKYVQETLEISRRQFFMLLNRYKENSSHFSIQYQRTAPPRCISAEIEQNILFIGMPALLYLGTPLPRARRVLPSCDVYVTAISA